MKKTQCNSEQGIICSNLFKALKVVTGRSEAKRPYMKKNGDSPFVSNQTQVRPSSQNPASPKSTVSMASMQRIVSSEMVGA